MKLSACSSLHSSRNNLLAMIVMLAVLALVAPSVAVVVVDAINAEEIQPPIDERGGDGDEDDDVTTLMKQRIESMQKYLDDPILYLNKMSFLGVVVRDEDGESYQEEDELMAMDIVQVLFDLEDDFEKSADKTREFYNLGGWPLLASFVSKNAHLDNKSSSVSYGCNSADDNNDDDLVSMQENILFIRASAADAMGAAIKNRDEFHSWVLEEQQDVVRGDDTTAAAPSTTATPLYLVTQALMEVSDAAETPGSCSELMLEYQEELAAKTMYALESFLRANAPAQVAFSHMTILEDDDNKNANTAKSSNPAQALGVQASRWAQEAAIAATDTQSSNARMSRHAIKMTRRLLALASDIVRDAPTAQDANSSNHQLITDVFSTNDWCQAAMQAATLSPASSFKQLVFSPLQRTALQSVIALGSHCSDYYINDGKELVTDLSRLYQQLQLLESEKEAAVAATTTTTTTTTTMNTRYIHQPHVEQINFQQLVRLALAAVVANNEESSSNSSKPFLSQQQSLTAVNTQIVYDLRTQRAVRA